MKNHSNTSLFEQLANLVRRLIYFVSYDIWRIRTHEIRGVKKLYIYLAKTIILAIRGFISEKLPTKASALTYSTLLSIIPLLAVLIGIAKGFGFQSIVGDELLAYFPGQENQVGHALGFVESYLAEARGGLFIGIGLLLLFYTVISLISSIEDTFNNIWQLSKSRPWNRRIIDYMALFLILPILMTLSGGFSVLLSTLRSTMIGESSLFTPFMKTLPFIISSLVFAIIYILLPNTKVQLLNGLAAGCIGGCCFQLFQMLYINGQIWVSKYNAIYGSFAALPLLMLWLQVSWLICLFGAELAYASQNVKKFAFERDSRHISRRYYDFLTLLVASLIAKRFAEGGKPYTADELSETYRIPLRLTSLIIQLLTELNIIIEVNYGDDLKVRHYHPAGDVHRLTVGLLLDKIDTYGSENFKIDTSGRFLNEWQTILRTRNDLLQSNRDALLINL
ncbi:MAG: YihY/virulence factor BrkB family protein [Tannerellaceae bacterium]|jgi:membrane protein|nr:YihY/virulence factor BrkB family protein [Tannerellaceae bacterium]